MLATGFGKLSVMHGKSNKKKKIEPGPLEPCPATLVLLTWGLWDGRGVRLPRPLGLPKGARLKGHLSGQRSVLPHSAGYRLVQSPQPSTGPRWNCLAGPPPSLGPRLHPGVG